jgi:hypothetical protein
MRECMIVEKSNNEIGQSHGYARESKMSLPRIDTSSRSGFTFDCVLRREGHPS